MSENDRATADLASAIATLEADLFFPFPANLPPPEKALARAYAAFAHYGPSHPFCRQCFTLEEERAVLAGRDLRTKAPDQFRAIYHEHPDCSVGAEGFLYAVDRP